MSFDEGSSKVHHGSIIRNGLVIFIGKYPKLCCIQGLEGILIIAIEPIFLD